MFQLKYLLKLQSNFDKLTKSLWKVDPLNWSTMNKNTLFAGSWPNLKLGLNLFSVEKIGSMCNCESRIKL